MWFIDVEVEQETSAPAPKKNPGSAPVVSYRLETIELRVHSLIYQRLNGLAL